VNVKAAAPVLSSFCVLFTNLHFLVEHFTLSRPDVLLDWFPRRLSMKKARWALLLLVLFVVPGAGQIEHIAAASQIEHAPTPEQCRADADAWGIPTAGVLVPNEQEFARLSTATALDPSVTAKMLDARMKQLTQCTRTDSNQSTRYTEANQAYAIAGLLRMANFMKRHNLTSQFLAEDEQGQR